MPVSTEGFGKGVNWPSLLRLNCMKTKFHNSKSRSPSKFFLVTLPDPKSHKISEQGPQGPVSPIDQKLSFSPRRKICSLETCFSQSFPASSSFSKTVTMSFSLGSFSVFVKNSHAKAMASSLKESPKEKLPSISKKV